MTAASRARVSLPDAWRSAITASSVDLARIFQDRIDRFPGAVSVALEKARMAPRVTGDLGLARCAARLLDLEQDDVVVAVEPQLVDLLHVAAFLALAPEAAARPAPVDRLAELRRAGERLAVHVREHEHVVRAHFLGDGGNEPVRVPFHVIEPAHQGSVAAA